MQLEKELVAAASVPFLISILCEGLSISPQRMRASGLAAVAQNKVVAVTGNWIAQLGSNGECHLQYEISRND